MKVIYSGSNEDNESRHGRTWQAGQERGEVAEECERVGVQPRPKTAFRAGIFSHLTQGIGD